MIYEIESEFGPILVDVEENEEFSGGRRNITLDKGGKFKKIGQTLESSVETVSRVANAMANKVQGMVRKPDEFSLEIGLAFKGEAGVVIAKTSAEGHLKVSMKWVKPQ